MQRLLLLLLVYLVFGSAQALPPEWTGAAAMTRTVRVKVDNVTSARGTIWVGVYESPDDFLDREKARLVALRVNTTGSAMIDISGMVVGKEYALGLFHDVNDNGEFDTNWLGLPAEPWGFSGRLRSLFRLPRFQEVAFRVEAGSAGQVVRLRQ
ncbi:DUF2141 domain-containing protein [Neolewinella lacunae]|uniref:DUF2141 domain-containing protein n=1 Tax=Neolewinella lacunae TaxID=1517758 RepID=A0A923PMB8_9BACT|nr:DUF2141 domain-containing protein [Neolewinella lacunae]MBC6993813.1 DUF2141 domain-containing protein [Neolewinella lacunae]MDN3635296.1 DUF2141 domain-containing protein [Neolewinella lacunae]